MQIAVVHGLQLSWNLLDSPRFLALVLGPRKPYYILS